MTVLTDHQFELLADESDLDGYLFGTGGDIEVNEDGFAPASGDWITQDGQNTNNGATVFGKDVLGAGSWTWDSFINKTSEAEARAALDGAASIWRNDSAARSYGSVSALRYCMGGMTRRIYGRPRRFAPTISNLILGGFVAITHDFACSDANAYDDEEQTFTATLSAAGASGGGMSFPATFPLNLLPSEESPEVQVVIGGSVRTYPIVRFNGPWVNPTITTDAWTISMQGTSLTAGQWIEVDPRPWMMTVLDQGGASRSGALGRQTYLEDVFFEANTRPSVRLSGSAPSGNASCELRWRNAYALV